MPLQERSPLFSLSLACRIVLNIHALNNEGTENNRLIPRRVGIATRQQNAEGNPHYAIEEVNAISGDMLKHIFMDHLRLIALDCGLPLCDACRALHSGRMMGNPEFVQRIADKNDATFWDLHSGKPQLNGARVTDHLLTCVMDDLGGILIPVGDGVRRESPLNFGWITGLPALTVTQQFTHTRHATHHPSRDLKTDPSKDAELQQRNSGQMLFERPASSGVYALTVHFVVYDLGYNHYARDYPDQVDGVPIDRFDRMAATLLALTETVRNPRGALISTQMPHVVHLEGFVSLSTSAAIAAPSTSPLQDDYLAAVENLVAPLKRLHGPDRVQIRPFQNEADLLNITADILEQYGPAQLHR